MPQENKKISDPVKEKVSEAKDRRRKVSVYIEGNKKPTEVIVQSEQAAKDMCFRAITEGISYEEDGKLVFVSSRRVMTATSEPIKVEKVVIKE